MQRVDTQAARRSVAARTRALCRIRGALAGRHHGGIAGDVITPTSPSIVFFD